VESQYGGAAEAAALSSAKIELAFGQIQDALGNALAPAFEKFATFFIEEVVPPLTTFFEVDFPIMLANFGAAGAGIVEAFEPIGEAIREAFQIPEDVTFLESLLESIANLPQNATFLEFADAVADLVPSLIELLPPLTELVLEMLPLLLMILPPLTDFVRGLSILFGSEGLAGAFAIAGEQLELFFTPVEYFQVLGEQLRTLTEKLATPWVNLSRAINGAYDALVRWIGLSGGNSPTANTDVARGNSANLRGRAGGGRVTGGMPYLVGEMGPELFMPGRGGNIVPNDRLGGGGTSITINVTAGMGANGNQIGEEIIRQIKRYERASGPVFARA
jgi:hypothetical protein